MYLNLVVWNFADLNMQSFSRECKQRWDMSQNEIKDFWDECIADKNVPKGAWIDNLSFEMFFFQYSIDLWSSSR